MVPKRETDELSADTGEPPGFEAVLVHKPTCYFLKNSSHRYTDNLHTVTHMTDCKPVRVLRIASPRARMIVRVSSLLIALVPLLLLAGCGDGNPPLVNLSLNPSTPQTVHVSQSFSVTTSVTNYTGTKPLNVTWALTCVGSCGTVIPNYTVVGQPVIYTAPATPPGGVVTLTADLMYGNAGPGQQLSITVLP